MAIKRSTAPAADQAPAPDGPAVDVTGYIRDASHDIEVACLLQDQPDLRTALHTITEWDHLLVAYLISPRP